MRKFILFCLLLCLIVFVSGSHMRLSRAGLACPDWPGCIGDMFVPNQSTLQDDDLAKFPGFKFSEVRAWKHMVHRFAAVGLGFALILLPLLTLFRKQSRAALVSISLFSLLLFGAQVLLGMWTITRMLSPVVVTAHLLLGFVLFGSLFWLFLRANPQTTRLQVTHSGSMAVIFGLLLLLIQIILGGWVSANFAYSACPDFPTCNGKWWPDANFIQGFPEAFQYGLEHINALSKQARVAILWTHRAATLLVFIWLGFVAFSSLSIQKPKRVRVAGNLLSLFLLLEIGSGIATSLFRKNLLELGLAHSTLSLSLLLALLYILFWLRYQDNRSAITGEPDQATDTLQPPAADVAATAVPVDYVPPTPENLFERLSKQLGKTRGGMSGVFGQLLGRDKVDAEWLEDAETSLLMADVGVDATQDIVNAVKQSTVDANTNQNALTDTLKQTMYQMLEPVSQPLTITEKDIRPFVILVVGVNGVGKTTTIGKLAKRLQQQGLSVMLAAGDTFRAAAVEQLQEWGKRNDIAVVAQHSGADSASVIYDACESAKAKKVDVLIADTAGRLHTKTNLMDELSKIKRILGKLDPESPHEVLLVLDAGTGQNALEQAKQFNNAVDVSGIVLTKLDGTAKGGMIFALAKNLGKPVRFIGVGESIDDLQDFDARRFIDALFNS
jgi:fused signal recognition particle receptor